MVGNLKLNFDIFYDVWFLNLEFILFGWGYGFISNWVDYYILCIWKKNIRSIVMSVYIIDICWGCGVSIC